MMLLFSAHINLSHSNIQSFPLSNTFCVSSTKSFENKKFQTGQQQLQQQQKEDESQMEIKWLEDSCVESNLIRWTRRWNECHGLVGFA